MKDYITPNERLYFPKTFMQKLKNFLRNKEC